MEKLGGSLQENLLVLLCWSKKSYQLVRNAVPVNLFTTEVYRTIVNAVYGYIDRYKKPPMDHLVDLLEDELKGKDKELYKNVVYAIREVRVTEEYILDQLEKFVRLQNLKLGIVRAHDAINLGNPEDAEVELEKALKERLSLFQRGITLNDALAVLRKNEGKLREALPLAIPILDRIGAGPARKELHSLIGPKKGGKTWWLIHLIKCALISNWKVCVVTLEVGELLYATRTLQSLYSLTLSDARKIVVTRFERDQLGRVGAFNRETIRRPSLLTREGRREAARGLGAMSRNLVIKEFPTRSLTVSGLKAYLDALERASKFVPDLLLVDYPGIMKVDTDNFRLDLMGVTADLRGIAGERNMAVAIVGQSNREGVKGNTITGVHAAEDFSVNMTADLVMAYSQTPAEYQLGLARLGVDASRVSKQFLRVMISQSYDLGQFCLDSALEMGAYWGSIKDMTGKENPEE